jgi:hypothetical protein
VLTAVDLAQIQDMSLDDFVGGKAAIFNQAVIAVLVAIFLLRGVAQKNNGS